MPSNRCPVYGCFGLVDRWPANLRCSPGSTLISAPCESGQKYWITPGGQRYRRLGAGWPPAQCAFKFRYSRSYEETYFFGTCADECGAFDRYGIAERCEWFTTDPCSIPSTFSDESADLGVEPSDDQDDTRMGLPGGVRGRLP